MFSKWHRLINGCIDSKWTKTSTWKLTNTTGILQESEWWRPVLRVSAGSGVGDYQTQNLVFEYGLIKISFKVVKIYNNWCQKRTHEAETNLHIESQSNWNTLIFWLNFCARPNFWNLSHIKLFSLKRTQICLKIAPFVNSNILNKNLVSKKLHDGH